MQEKSTQQSLGAQLVQNGLPDTLGGARNAIYAERLHAPYPISSR